MSLTLCFRVFRAASSPHWPAFKYQTLATWLQQRKRRRRATTQRKTPAKVRWLEAVVGQTADSRAGSSLSVQLPGGERLEITCTRQIPLAAALLGALEKAGAC